jgi:hypothetical protein
VFYGIIGDLVLVAVGVDKVTNPISASVDVAQYLGCD